MLAGKNDRMGEERQKRQLHSISEKNLQESPLQFIEIITKSSRTHKTSTNIREKNFRQVYYYSLFISYPVEP